MQFQGQIDRIKQKLAAYLSTQRRRKLPKPFSLTELEAWEFQSNQRLPEPFRLFLLEIGTPVPSAFCGVEVELDRFSEKKACRLSPESADPARWQQLWETEETGDLFGGLLRFESQGCLLFTSVVLNGNNCGRIVYIDDEGETPPFWCHELHVLDWYERWLDEVALGYRFDRGYRFGEGPIGGEPEIFDWINDSQRPISERAEAIYALRKLSSVTRISELAELAQWAPLTMRIACVTVIGDCGMAELLGPITGAIADQSAELRRIAAKSIWRFLEQGACVEACVPFLEQVVLTDDSSDVAAISAAALKMTKNLSRSLGLSAINSSAHVSVVSILSQGFAWQLDDEGLLVRLLNHQSLEVQNWAAQGLLRIDPVALSPSIDKLTDCLVKGQHDYIAIHLLKHLRRFTAPEVADMLLKWIDSINDYCRIESITGLIKLGDNRVLDAALRMLEESRPPRFSGQSSTQLMSEYVYLAALESPNKQLARNLVDDESMSLWQPNPKQGFWTGIKTILH